MTIAENMVLKQHNRPPFANRSVLSPGAIRQHSENLVKNYNVRTPSINLSMDSLSGGNQQKVVLARELELKPHVLVADQPTRGLDVGAIEYIHKLLLEARHDGVGILLISTELDEIMRLSDRIVVMFEGQITYEVEAAEADIEKIGLAMAGEDVIV
jgi:simple sugar transport system ATP-binding protein